MKERIRRCSRTLGRQKLQQFNVCKLFADKSIARLVLVRLVAQRVSLPGTAAEEMAPARSDRKIRRDPLATRAMASSRRMAAAWALGAAGYALGLVLSTALDLPTGPAIVWALAALALCCGGGELLGGAPGGRRIAPGPWKAERSGALAPKELRRKS